MKYIKPLVFLIAIPLLSFTVLHKYYLSVTKIEYIEEKQSLQIITRVFLDDLENVLQERYDDSITLDEEDESTIANTYIERYLKGKIKIKINGKETNLNFIGKEYSLDVMKCYLEINNITHINSFEISNKLLFDVIGAQQNITNTKINSKRKSFVLTAENDKALLKFN